MAPNYKLNTLIGVTLCGVVIGGCFLWNSMVERKADIRSHYALLNSQGYKNYANSVPSRSSHKIYNGWFKLSQRQRCEFCDTK